MNNFESERINFFEIMKQWYSKNYTKVDLYFSCKNENDWDNFIPNLRKKKMIQPNSNSINKIFLI